jgi:hypothetical protein
MSIEQIVNYLKSNIEPIPNYDQAPLYRCAAYLTDGTYLPCVAFQSASRYVDLAMKRFDESRPKFFKLKSSDNQLGYRGIVQTFVTSGNCINDYDIHKVEKSPYAIPLERLKEIKGETSMGWTGFDVLMNDGKIFSFGTSFYNEFFNMPQGYSAIDIRKIIPHSVGQKSNVLTYREKPFFCCYTRYL